MDLLVALVVVMITIIEVHGKNLDPGHQAQNNTLLLSSQPGQQRYATKEIILYLTPSQIRALQQGRGLINTPHADSDKHTQAYLHTHPQALSKYQNEHLHSHVAHPQSLKTPPIQEPQSEPFIPIIPAPEYRQPGSTYNRFQHSNSKQIPKPIPFFPESNKETLNNEPKSLTASLPQEPIQGKDQNDEVTRNQIKEQWLHLLNENRAHFKALDALSQNQREKSNENNNIFHYLLQNNHRYNNQKYASDVYNLVRLNNEQQLEKQRAFSQAEAFANSPPVFVHKEINIKHTPGHLIAHVPIPAPVSAPVPEPFNVKVPREYAVPLETLRTVPVPVVKAQTNDLDQPAPIETEKHITAPVPKLYVDRPLFVDRVVPLGSPVPNPGNLPIHNHEWHY